MARRYGAWVRRALRILLVILVALVVLPPVWAELGPASAPRVVPARIAAPTDSLRRYRVFVAGWRYHTSIIVEQPSEWRLGPPGREASPFVEYAWGDRRFYKDSDYRPHSLIITLFLPSEAVTYVDAWPRAPSMGGGMRQLMVRELGARELVALARELEAWRSDGPPYPPVAGYAGRFYPAPGRYLWWTNCNRWTVERLEAAGLARGGRGVIFPGQVAARLRGFQPAAAPLAPGRRGP